MDFLILVYNGKSNAIVVMSQRTDFNGPGQTNVKIDVLEIHSKYVVDQTHCLSTRPRVSMKLPASMSLSAIVQYHFTVFIVRSMTYHDLVLKNSDSK